MYWHEVEVRVMWLRRKGLSSCNRRVAGLIPPWVCRSVLEQDTQLFQTCWLVPCMAASWWKRGMHFAWLWIKGLYKCSQFTIYLPSDQESLFKVLAFCRIVWYMKLAISLLTGVKSAVLDHPLCTSNAFADWTSKLDRTPLLSSFLAKSWLQVKVTKKCCAVTWEWKHKIGDIGWQVRDTVWL